jgi:hypothetical protein
VDGDGKGKKCHQLKKSHNMNLQKKSLLVSKKIAIKSEQTIQISI